MTNLLMPPAPAGDLAEQVRGQYAYLFQLAQQLNLALEGTEQAVREARSESRSAASAAQLAAGYDQLKSLIVKTADTVTARMDKLRTELAGEYMALSDFGSYVERLSAVIEADPTALTQYYTYFSDLRADVDAVSGDFTDWRNAVQATIRTGIVDYRDGVPVYGLAVGQQLETSVDTATGDTVIEKRHFRAIYAANRLSFWEDGVEVAYVSDHQLYIRDVVALSSLAVGRWSVTDGSAGLTFQWIGG